MDMTVFDGRTTAGVRKNTLGEIPCPVCKIPAFNSPHFEVEAYLCPKCRRVWKVIPTGVTDQEIPEYLRLSQAMRTKHQNRRKELLRQWATWWADELKWRALEDTVADPANPVEPDGLLENFEEVLRNGEDPFATSWELCGEIWKILTEKRNKQ